MNGPNQPPVPFGDDDPPVFVVREGQVWACWLSGKPPISLGPAAQVHAAMEKFLEGDARRPAAGPAPPPASQPEAPLHAATPEPEAAAVDRAEPRHDISIIGRVHTGAGVRDVTILDLSEQGCRFHDRFCTLRPGMPVSVRIGPVGPVRSSVKWRRGEYVGIKFDNPLYPSVLQHIASHFDLRK